MRIQRSIHFLLFLFLVLAIPATLFAQFGVSITVAPPELVAYSQPLCPQEGYLWTPGYWAYGPDGYFWVPGTWVEPPQPGLLWTPGYWSFADGVYAFNRGYWGPMSAFTAASITASAMAASVTKAGIGRTACSSTTAR